MTRSERIRKALDQLDAKVLLPAAQPESAGDGIQFTSLCYDSRQVEPGAAFFCLPGETTDGNRYALDAIKSGAGYVVSQHHCPELEVPQIIVPDVRLALAVISDYFFDSPSRKLRLLGVTGTNGKTTTTHLIETVLNRTGLASGLIGTLGARWKGSNQYGEAKHTTPQAPDLQRLLSDMVDSGCTHVAMEVSSHSLSLLRVAGCHFAAACLTNVTQDHLDFHKTMDNYWRSKRMLFDMLEQSKQDRRLKVVNLDDRLAVEFLKGSSSEVRVLTYGFDSSADLRVMKWSHSHGVTNAAIATPWGELQLAMHLAGKFNVYNVLAAAAICLHEGVSPETFAEVIGDFPGVPGRFEVVSAGGENEPLCIVDYAHTPDGLENVLKTARELKNEAGKLIVVFGCGGDRDPSKRPKMGAIAKALGDEIIVTSDNPRTEDPQAIIANILTGIQRMRNVEVEPDRARAIRLAVNMAQARDIVVVAGKGHENYQLVMNKVLPFDDKVELRRALEEKALPSRPTNS